MNSAFLGLLRKEAYHIVRDRRTLVVLLAMPVLQVVLFGYAIRTDVEDVKLAIVDPSPDQRTLELRNRLGASDVFRITHVLRTTDELEHLFQANKARQAIVFEPGFAERLARGLTAHVQVITDATEPNTGSAMQAYALNVVQAYEREVMEEGGGQLWTRAGDGANSGSQGALLSSPTAMDSPTQASTRTPARVRIQPELRMRFNPTRESSNLFIPGLIAFVLTLISTLMTAISLTREKETGTMEVLLVSPLRPIEIIAGKVAPYIAIGFISVTAVVIEAHLIFNVPVRGSVALLLAEGVLYTIASLALGIFISSRTSSQRVAMTAALAGTMLPTVLLSGFIFPLESMPVPLQVIANAMPAKWFVLIARGIMLKGIGLEYLWQETLILLAITTLLLAMSTRSFKVRLA